MRTKQQILEEGTKFQITRERAMIELLADIRELLEKLVEKKS